MSGGRDNLDEPTYAVWYLLNPECDFCAQLQAFRDSVPNIFIPERDKFFVSRAEVKRGPARHPHVLTDKPVLPSYKVRRGQSA